MILLAGGLAAAFWLARKPLADGGDAEPALGASFGEVLNAEGESSQIRLLEGQVEYLEGQVRALREENEALLEQLGRLGMKDAGAPGAKTAAPAGETPDYVGMGLDLTKLRELDALPLPVRAVPAEGIEQRILDWLRSQQPGDRGERFGRALHALGWIPESVDPLPLRAALLRRQLGGWYDAEEGTLLLEENDADGGDVFRAALGVTFAQVLREFGGVLFPPQKDAPPLTLDRQLARESLLGGDAGLTRLLYSLQNPAIQSAEALPPEDPDHPFNQVPLPQFLRQLHFFPFNEGFEFMQGLHGLGGFARMSAAYRRPPSGTAEVLDVERYLNEPSLPPVEVSWHPAEVLGRAPFWDDVLGQYAILTALRAWNDDERAGLGARGWTGDRLLAYAADDAQARGHVVWQTLWQDVDWAEAFFRAMLECLRQQYQLPEPDAESGLLNFESQDRHVTLLRNRGQNGVLLIDAGSGEFAEELLRTFRGEER